jgi:hypothetical protein
MRERLLASSWWIAMGAASVALVACIWNVPYIPTNDGPQIALTSHIQNHYADADSLFPHQVVPNFAFTHLGFTLLFTPLEAVLPWRDAFRLTLSVFALGMAWAFAWMAAAFDPRRRPLGLLGFVFAMTWNFYMGFFSYEVAIALGLALVGLVARWYARRPVRAPHWVLVGAALLAVAAAHVFAALWTGLAIVCIVMARAPAEARLRELGRTLCVGLPSMALLCAAWSQHRDLARVAMTSAFTWIPPSEQALRFPALVLPGPHIRAWIATISIAAALASVLVRWRRVSTDERSLACVALALLGAAFLAPLDVPGWQFLSPRLIAPVPALAVALVPLERLTASRSRLVALGAIAATAMTSLAASGALHRRLYRGCADDLSGLDDPVRRSSYVLPIVLDPYCGVDRAPDRSEIPYLAPARHLGALYALAQGGSIPYLFAGSSSAYAFRLRDPPDALLPLSIPSVERFWTAVESEPFRDDAAFRRRVLTELALHGTGYEAILAFGTEPRDVDVFEEIGYAPERAQGSLLVATFRGCRASLRLRATAAREPLRLEWGAGAIETAITDRIVPPAPEDATGTLVLPLGRIVCGSVWLRVSLAPGTPGPREVCADTDSLGRLHAVVAPERPSMIECARPAAAEP